MENLKEYHKAYWQKNKQKYKRFSVSLSDENLKRLEELEKATGFKRGEILKKAITSALSDEKLVLGSVERGKAEQERIEAILRILGGIGTNINQIAKGINARRLAGSFFKNAKKDERARILEACEELENLVLKLRGK